MGGGKPKYDDWSQFKKGGGWQLYDSKYTKRDQLNFAKDLYIFTILPQMVPIIQIWVVDQAEQNRGYFTKIKDEMWWGYVKVWQYDGNRGWGGYAKI